MKTVKSTSGDLIHVFIPFVLLVFSYSTTHRELFVKFLCAEDNLAKRDRRDDGRSSWYKRVGPFCICFYCICRRARVGLRRILYPFRRVTAHASRNSTHDGEGERKRGLGMGFHRVNYTIFAALCVGFRGRFPWLRKVSVVRREQIRVLIKTAPLPVHPRCGRPLVGGYAQTAAETAA